MKNLSLLVGIISLGFTIFSCSSVITDDEPKLSCNTIKFNYNNEKGCDGRTYIDPNITPYVLPFLPSTSFKTGLTNCSSSYHSASRPDRYAFDFDVPIGSHFYATRAGVVVYVENDQPSEGGGVGNGVIIEHDDKTFAIYLHSPKGGVRVSVGDIMGQGDYLGETGMSGAAGYPHLHFTVVQNDYKWPYDAIPITFKNILPADVIVKTKTEYRACDY